MPCAKGMGGCATLCGHRRLIQDYRAERERQWSELIELTGGYDTEIADRLRELREQGTPLIDYKTWLIQSKRTPEDREMPENNGAYSTALVKDQIIGDPAAEQALLATVMEHPEMSHHLLQLRRGEFTEPFHQITYDAIADLTAAGIEPAASTVENWIREANVIANSPEWNSRFYRPTAPGDTLTMRRDGVETTWNRADLGLRGWRSMAVHDEHAASWLASTVRDHTMLRMTTEAHQHTTEALKATFANQATSPCDVAQETGRINHEFQMMMQQVPAPLPIVRAHEFAVADGVRTRAGSAMEYSAAMSGAVVHQPARAIRR